MNAESPPTALVYGLGFMGGSLAAALTQAGWTVYLHHRRVQVMEAAQERGFGVAVNDPCEVMPDCHIAIVCTPVTVIVDHVRNLAAAEGTAVITDIGSTKTTICSQLDDLAVAGRFIGSHPMAGSHLQGLDHADPSIYQGCRTAITPHERCPGRAIAALQAFWTSVGCTCHPYSPSDHDQAVAEISHLPHLLASAAAAALTERGLTLASTGFRDTTRIAAASPDLWTAILKENRNAVAYQLEQSMSHQRELLHALQMNNGDAIQAWLERGRRGRTCFEKRRFD